MSYQVLFSFCIYLFFKLQSIDAFSVTGQIGTVVGRECISRIGDLGLMRHLAVHSSTAVL